MLAKYLLRYQLGVLLALVSCSTGHEVIMPFRNMGYSAERILPVKTSNADYELRIWVNNSTSIDRIVSISRDTLDGFSGYLSEIGIIVDGKKNNQYYRKASIVPKSGFESFISRMDSIGILELSNQEDNLSLPLHQPFSIYVIEIKQGSRFNTFKFKSYYPYEGQIDKKYKTIEKIIFAEFALNKLFLFKQ